MLDLPHVGYTTSGRASILLALELLGIRPGDRVLLPTYHCPTMVAPTVELGATPVFYPINDQGAPGLDWLDNQDLKGVKAILVPHFFGQPQAMSQVRQWCDAHGLALIEDCAHALFGRSDGRAIGSWGNLAIGSLTKFLPVPEGGCLVNNSQASVRGLRPAGLKVQLKAVLDMLEVGARHGRWAGLNRLICLPLDLLRGWRRGQRSQEPASSKETLNETANAAIDQNFSIDVALAHRGLAPACRWAAQTLPRHRVVDNRRQNYQRFAQALAGHAGLRPLKPDLPDDCAPYVFPIWVDHPDPGYAELRRQQLPVFRWDRLWPGISHIEGDAGPNWSHHVLQLGCHQDLSQADIDHFVGVVLGLFASRDHQAQTHTPAQKLGTAATTAS